MVSRVSCAVPKSRALLRLMDCITMLVPAIGEPRIVRYLGQMQQNCRSHVEIEESKMDSKAAAYENQKKKKRKRTTRKLV